MALADRDYAREPLPGEEFRPEKSKISVDDLEDYELNYGGERVKIEKVEHVTLGWGDVVFWAVLLLIARAGGG